MGRPSRTFDTLPVLGDGPVAAAARIMGLSAREFEKLLPKYLERGFPRPDEVSGLLDLDAVVEWRKRRHPELYALTAPDEARDARSVVHRRLEEMGRGGGRKAR